MGPRRLAVLLTTALAVAGCTTGEDAAPAAPSAMTSPSADAATTTPGPSPTPSAPASAGGGTGTPTPTTSATPATPTATSTPPAPVTPASTAPPAAPTPASPLRSDGFTTPTGTTLCLLGGQDGDVLGCDIASGLVPPPSLPCDTAWPGLSLPRAGPATPICAGDTIIGLADGVPTLAYGQVWEGPGLTCVAERRVLTCRNDTGAGFELAPEGWRTTG